LQDFAGRSFHSARWDTQYDLSGKRVAVIGTGASAIQFVPNIVNTVAHLTVFQRSGNWLLPLKNLPYAKTISTCFRRMPALSRAWRTCISLYLEGLTAMARHPRTLGKIGKFVSSAFMRRQLRDPETRKKAWPDYPYGCKRILFSSSYLPALQRANVSLITERIVRMTPQGPETADGKIHEVDCVIYSTGFRAMDFMFPMEITGVAGRSLREAWAQGAKAHLGITIAGFPSLFVMYGPNTNTSGGSVVYFVEAQARYLRQALQWMRQQQATAIDVRPEVEAASTAKVQSRFQGTAWTACHSWYQDAHGRIVANWPGYMREYARQTARLNPDDYRLIYAKA
jgi:cation diffusion facilitator CzcD-associated flavoprotein CzcO